MSVPNVQNAVVKYLDEANLLQVVTFAGDRPWVATVFFAADNRHYLYWLSPPGTRHSRDIQRNNRICGAITLPHAYGQSPQGLQFEGLAREVPFEEVNIAFQSFAERYNAHHRLDGLLDGTDENRLYEIVPDSFVLYDEEHFPTAPRQEWQLKASPFVNTDVPVPEDPTDSTQQPPASDPETDQTAAPYNPLDS